MDKERSREKQNADGREGAATKVGPEAQDHEKKRELERRQREERKKTEAYWIESIRKQRARENARIEKLEALAIPPHWQKYRNQLLELARRRVLLKWQKHFVDITEARKGQTALRSWAKDQSQAGRLPPEKELHNFRRQGGLASLETSIETTMRRDLQRRHTNPLFPYQKPQVSDRVFPKEWNIDHREEAYREWSRRCLGALHRTPDISAEREERIWANTNRWLDTQKRAGRTLGGAKAYEAHPRLDDYRSIIDGEVLREAQHALGWTEAHVNHLARQLDNYIDFELFDKCADIKATLKDLEWQQYEPAMRQWAQKQLGADLAPRSRAGARAQALGGWLQENVDRGNLPDWAALDDEKNAKTFKYVFAHLIREALQQRHAIELQQHDGSAKARAERAAPDGIELPEVRERTGRSPISDEFVRRASERIRKSRQRREDEKTRGKDRDGGRERE